MRLDSPDLTIAYGLFLSNKDIPFEKIPACPSREELRDAYYRAAREVMTHGDAARSTVRERLLTGKMKDALSPGTIMLAKDYGKEGELVAHLLRRAMDIMSPDPDIYRLVLLKITGMDRGDDDETPDEIRAIHPYLPMDTRLAFPLKGLAPVA